MQILLTSKIMKLLPTLYSLPDGILNAGLKVTFITANLSVDYMIQYLVNFALLCLFPIPVTEDCANRKPSVH
jgi:hypothetical protein